MSRGIKRPAKTGDDIYLGRQPGSVTIPLWQKPQVGKGRLGDGAHLHWTTSHGSKEEAFAHARQMVNGDRATLHDWATVTELLHIREVGGVIGAQDGEHDDHAMALVLALWNLRTTTTERE